MYAVLLAIHEKAKLQMISILCLFFPAIPLCSFLLFCKTQLSQSVIFTEERSCCLSWARKLSLIGK